MVKYEPRRTQKCPKLTPRNIPKNASFWERGEGVFKGYVEANSIVFMDVPSHFQAKVIHRQAAGCFFEGEPGEVFF